MQSQLVYCDAVDLIKPKAPIHTSTGKWINNKMPETKVVLLPYNMVEDKRYKNKSIYVSDFCSRRRHIPERRQMRTKETPLYAKDIYNPTTRFLNDHYQTTSHRELKQQCEKILNNIERSSSRMDCDIGMNRDKRAPLYNGLPMTPSVIEDDQPLVDVLPLSLRRIESAWQEEVNTTKRERGDIYGKAGAKKWYNQREKEETRNVTNQKLIPGLSKWLNEANEYEKIVVHDFMKNVSDTINEERTPSRSKIYKDSYEKQHYSDNPKIEDYLDYIPDNTFQPDFIPPSTPPLLEDDDNLLDSQQIFAEAQLSQEKLLEETEAYKSVTFRNPTRETIATGHQRIFPDQRCPSRASTTSSNKDISPAKIENLLDYSEQRPRSAISLPLGGSQLPEMKRSKSSLGLYRERPPDKARPTSSHSSATSITRFINRAKSAEVPHRIETPEKVQRVYSAGSNRNYRQQSYHTHTHCDSNCKSCQDTEIRRIADKLSRMEPRSYRRLKEEATKRPKMAISKMYKSKIKDYNILPEDNVYTHSVFGKVSAPDRGYFIIHPEWVSERAKPKKSYR